MVNFGFMSGASAVFILTVPPLGRAMKAESDGIQRLLQLNEGIRALPDVYAKEGKKCFVVDLFTLVAEGTGDGKYFLAPQFDADGIHLTPPGYSALAAAVVDLFKREELLK